MDNILNAVDVQIHHLDAAQFGALALLAAVVLALILAVNLVIAMRVLKRLSELRDLERDGYIRHHQMLEAILQHVAACDAEVTQLKKDIAARAASRDAQLEERKKILKAIAGHLRNPAGADEWRDA